VFFASLAGNYLGQIDRETGTVMVLEPPVPRQGARRVWSDSRGALWITGWNSGDLFRYDSKSKAWAHWHLPGDRPQPYAVYVDETDAVWVSDWGGECDPTLRSEDREIRLIPTARPYAGVRQLASRGERQTLRWRELDSNPRSRSVIGELSSYTPSCSIR